MDWALAKVTATTPTGLHIAGARFEGHAPLPPGPPLRAGALVLVGWDGTGWAQAIAIQSGRAPRLPAKAALRRGFRGSLSGAGLYISVTGQWAIDDEGLPVEVCQVRLPDGQRAALLSYVAWKFASLQLDALQLHRCAVGGAPVLVLTVPRGESIHDIPRKGRRVSRRAPPRPRPPAPTPVSRPVPVEVTLDRVLPADAVTWRDGSVRVTLSGLGQLDVHLAAARAAFEPLKDMLEGVSVHLCGPLGALTATASPSLEERFALAQRAVYVAAHQSSEEWSTLSAVAAGYYGGDRDPGDVLGIPEFALSGREAAFRRLFESSPPGAEAIVWKGMAMLFPVRIDGADTTAWVWEVPRENHASYLFLPPGPAALAELKALLGSPTFRRQAFLDAPGQHAAVGFGGRVMHTGSVGEWWQRLVGRLGKMRRTSRRE